MRTKIAWETRRDDGLLFADNSVDFLRSEFQPEGIDEVWFDGYFQWKLGEVNPAGKGYFTVGIADDKIVATLSLTKKRILLNGKEYAAAEFGDAYCSDSFFNNLSAYVANDNSFQGLPPSHYLNKSIFGRIAYETTERALADNILILYGTPNQNALPSWIKRLGHFHFQDHNIHIFLKHTFRHLVNKYWYLKPFRFLRQFPDKALSFCLRLWLGIKAKKKIHILENTPSANEINALWERTKPAAGFSMVRDFAYWNYRYCLHPLSRYTLYTVKSGNETCGIVAGCKQKVAEGTYRFSFVEWMVAPGYSLSYILAEIIHSLRNEQIDHFVTYANLDSEDSGDFKQNIFVRSAKVTITFYKTDLINPESLKGQPFHFYMGSTDAL
jgi:hypothetical protein